MAWGSKDIHLLPLLGNAFLLQSWFPIKEMEGNSVAWCLSTLIFFYAVYPVLAKLEMKRLIALFILHFLLISLLSYTLIPSHLQEWYWYKFPPTRILDFILGMILYHLYIKLDKAKLPSLVYRDVPPIIFFAVGLFIVHGQTNLMELSGRVFYLASAVTILSYALFERKFGIPSWLKFKFLLYLGEISFSFYMIHNLAILITKQALSKVYPDHHWALRFVITFVATIIGSVIVNKYFEQPISKLLSRNNRR